MPYLKRSRVHARSCFQSAPAGRPARRGSTAVTSRPSGLSVSAMEGVKGKILVTGPTGNVGKHVVSLAAEMGHDVRALVRDPGKASLPEGVDVAHGDLSSPDTLLAALRDVDSVYLMWPGLAVDARVVELMAEHV